MVKNIAIIGLLCGIILPMHAQQRLTLDSCRAMALRNNKQVIISRLKQDAAQNVRRAARTKHLPRVSAVGGYEWMSREVSLLSNTQKSALSNMGTLMGQQLGSSMQTTLADMAQQGLLTADQAQQLGDLMGQGVLADDIQQTGNSIGQQIVDAYHSDTHNLFGAAVMVSQPIYMGGAITAANRMADIAEDMAAHDLDLKTQSTLYDIDRAYWTVVSLKQKQRLAQSYRDLVKRLDDDVHKMIREGVATRADGLRVDVKVNEADMQMTQVEDGLSLARMALCQLCGLPLGSAVILAEEDEVSMPSAISITAAADATLQCRPEVRLLESAIELSEQNTRLVRAAFLPHVAVTGGYLVTNPSVYDGFRKRFSGVWNVGIMVQVPIWTWNEGGYKIRASRTLTRMAEMELADTQEKISLQVMQGRHKVAEARKRLAMAMKNTESAEENLRCAQVGFREGVMDATDVMTAQTAWQQAQSQKIDAEVELRLCAVNLEKALGQLRYTP